MRWRLALRFALGAGAVALSLATGHMGPAGAQETIAGALALAYGGNPTLQADRARQRATDELVPQALSGWRPTVIANGDTGYESHSSRIKTSDGNSLTSTGDHNPLRFAIGLSQPIFRGFRTVSETAAAEATVAAGQQNLLAVEQEVLLNAATAFMDVLRDRAVILLRQRNVTALGEQLRAAQARFDVGEVTRTDVEQGRAASSLAEAELAVARANLAASVAFYVQMIGRQPGSLRYPPVSPLVPKSLDEALALADRLNPQILAAAFNADAARYNIDLAVGALLPTISLEAEYRAARQPDLSVTKNQHAAVLGVLQMPLYQAGRVASEVREAKQVASQRRIEIVEAGRAVREAVVRTWNIFVAAGETIESLRAQVAANELALEGVRQEAQVGTRTTLDVLDAERLLVTSQVSLVTAQRDQIVAAYQLIAATGRMTARNLRLPVAAYEPNEHYLKTRGRWIGIGTDTVD